ncbi:conserved unknown protein [Ectocarpus siliculosus]|uniref:Uncharacterized protein n=1 Tax=Ectocarpus siliculosus TaxID=2880 RepID=D7G683_ECTSI|nr:conserved unknown protein [Ectocarpus siliculosus]|eukprot:CBJ27478.1 conserved unknown protein [Ectocarpus siliculosus]
MKDAKPSPQAAKSSKGTVTKGEGTSIGAASGQANEAAVKKATKKMKKALDKAIRAHDDGDFISSIDLLEEVKEDAEFDFEEEELEELIWTFVERNCSDSDVVKFLVEQGLELERDSCNDDTPLVWAVSHGRFDAVEALLKAGANPTDDDYVFVNAASFLNGSMLRLLIKYGANVNAGSERDGTILHMIANKAVAVGDLACLELLLEAGAKERSAVGDKMDSDFQAEMTPTQLIQKTYGGDASKVGVLERAVDLLYEHSSAGKRAAKLENKINELSSALGVVAQFCETFSNHSGGGAAGGGGLPQAQPGIVPANNMPGFMPGFMPGYMPGMPFQGGVQGFPGLPGVAPPGVPQGQARGESKKESGSGPKK